MILSKPNPRPAVQIPKALLFFIELQLKQLQVSLDQSRLLAESIQRMSDFYISQPGQPTPWQEPWCQIAQIAYYLPLNTLRILGTLQTNLGLQKRFLESDIVDFGCGLSPTFWVWLSLQEQAHLAKDTQVDSPPDGQNTDFHSGLQFFVGLDHAQAPISIHQNFQEQLESLNKPADPQISPSPQISGLSKLLKNQVHWQISSGHTSSSIFDWKTPKMKAPQVLRVFSYSLNELAEQLLEKYKPNQTQAEWLILEPSTSQQGRKLMSLRQKLIDQGFEILGPCTHQEACPLLIESKSDWCHDRVHIEMPDWFKELENHLPFKNRTITWSYLWAVKRAFDQKPDSSSVKESKWARVVGDTLKEKGKTRQLICRGAKREYLSQLDRSQNQVAFPPRGVLAQIEPSLESKGNEIRLK